MKYPTLPECYHYHPNSELSKRSGYYPNIDKNQLKAVNEMFDLIERNQLNINIDEEHEFLKVLRFLRARKYNVVKSFDMLKKDVEWRLLDNRLTLRNETAQQVLDGDVNEVCKYFPAWIQGYDKQSRPVSYRQFGKFEIWNVLKSTTLPRLIRYHAWETEQALKLMYNKSSEYNYNIETFVVVVDAAGWKMKLATRDAYTFIKGMASTDSDHYPERLGMLIVINAPSMLSVAWKVVKGFLDDVTKAKIKIFSKESEWKPVLFDAIDPDQVPIMYGGTAPNPDIGEAIKAMNNNDIEESVENSGDIADAEAVAEDIAKEEGIDLTSVDIALNDTISTDTPVTKASDE